MDEAFALATSYVDVSLALHILLCCDFSCAQVGTPHAMLDVSFAMRCLLRCGIEHNFVNHFKGQFSKVLRQRGKFIDS